MIVFPARAYGLIFRMVEESDAAFIMELRTNPQLSKYLSPTDNDLHKQVEWISNYKLKEKNGQEYYFIYTDEEHKPLGVSRLYKLENNTLTSGSWLAKPGNDVMVALKADLFFLLFTFEELKYDICFIDVRKDNKKLLRFHRLFFTQIREDKQDVYFYMDKEGYQKKRDFLISIIQPQQYEH